MIEFDVRIHEKISEAQGNLVISNWAGLLGLKIASCYTKAESNL